MPHKKKNAGAVNNDMLAVVAALSKTVADLVHNKGNATATKKGKKKHRVLLDEAQRARLKQIKDDSKAAGTKYSERRKLVRDYLKSIKSAQRTAGILPVAVIPATGGGRQQVKPMSAGDAMKTLGNLVEQQRKLVDQLAGAPSDNIADNLLKRLIANSQKRFRVATAGAAGTSDAVSKDKLEAMALDAADDTREFEQKLHDIYEAQRDESKAAMSDAEKRARRDEGEYDDGVVHELAQYRTPSFGGGMGRRAMLSRWG